jgi:hypothetical protein
VRDQPPPNARPGSPAVEPARRSSRAAWIGLGLVVVAAGAFAGWRLIGSPASPGAAKEGAPPPRAAGGRPYLAAQHVDGAASRLYAGPDGKGLLDVVLRDVVDGEPQTATLREGMDATTATVFLRRGEPTSTIGLLSATSNGTGKPGETRLTIELPHLPARATVVDLRWKGWEGFELAAESAAPK